MRQCALPIEPACGFEVRHGNLRVGGLISNNWRRGCLGVFTGAKLCERLHEGVGLPYLLWISVYTGDPRLAQLTTRRVPLAYPLE